MAEISLAAPTDGEAPRLPSSSIGPIALAGLLAIVVFFGGFGGWAALAPLDGAIVADGIVSVDGNRKSVEHLEGGIVKRVLVKDGARIEQGAPLVVLDDARLRAQVEIFTQQMLQARASEARLVAERDGAALITFPDDLATSTDAAIRKIVASQMGEFESRRAALAGAEQVLRHRIEDFSRQIDGKRARRAAVVDQLASVEGEQQSLAKLLGKGLTTKERLLSLDRSAAGLKADLLDYDSAIASAEENIAETEAQIAQLGRDRSTEVASGLADIQAKLLDLGPSLENARAALERTVVRAPYAGTIVGLQVFSTGAVIPPGGRILDIVPDRQSLVVEARVRVEDITELATGAAAEVHLANLRHLYVPTLHGKVVSVSADRLTDQRTGLAYFSAEIEIDPQELATRKDVMLYPGMQAQVMVVTERRTALEYLLSPLIAALDSAFRQG